MNESTKRVGTNGPVTNFSNIVKLNNLAASLIIRGRNEDAIGLSIKGLVLCKQLMRKKGRVVPAIRLAKNASNTMSVRKSQKCSDDDTTKAPKF